MLVKIHGDDVHGVVDLLGSKAAALGGDPIEAVTDAGAAAVIGDRQQTDECAAYGDHGAAGDPSGGPSDKHDALDPLLDIDFSKGQRTSAHAFGGAAGEQGARVVSALLLFHGGDALLIAAFFQIAGKQPECQPHEGIAPAPCQDHEGQCLPPVILMIDMRLLMGDHII